MANWITATEASKISGYSLQKVQRLMREKKVAREKKGKAYWADRESLLAYVKANSHSDANATSTQPNTKEPLPPRVERLLALLVEVERLSRIPKP